VKQLSEEPVKKPIPPVTLPKTPGPPAKDLKALTPIQLPRTPNVASSGLRSNHPIPIPRVARPGEDQKALTPIQIPRVARPGEDQKALTPIQIPRPPLPETQVGWDPIPLPRPVSETLKPKSELVPETDRLLRKRKPK
jgi:hypothetical protein